MAKKKMSNWLNKKSFEKKDEYYTPRILVDAIIPYIPGGVKTIWCPFDTENSEFVIELKEAGYNVVFSHIWEGKDFFTYEPEQYDCIISNPPYSRKIDIFKRLYELNKPFAVIFGLPILNYQEIGEFFVGKDLQLLIVDKKVSFDGNTASFNSSYFCHDFLQKDLMFHHLEHNNARAHYVPSRMYDSK